MAENKEANEELGEWMNEQLEKVKKSRKTRKTRLRKSSKRERLQQISFAVWNGKMTTMTMMTATNHLFS